MGMVITDAKPVVVGVRCDACGRGMMEPVTDGFSVYEAFATDPPLYGHRCSVCGTVQLFRKKYPDICFIWSDNEFREPTTQEKLALGV